MTTSTLGPFAEPIHTWGAWGAWWRGWYRLLRLFGSTPFPGNAISRLAGRHVAGTGVFFRPEPVNAANVAPVAPVTPGDPPPGGPT